MTPQTFFLIVFTLLQIADIWTTHKALAMGKREANPLLARLFKDYPPLLVMVMLKTVAIWLMWYADMYVVTGVLCAFYIWVVNNNLDVIEGRR